MCGGVLGVKGRCGEGWIVIKSLGDVELGGG